MPKIRDLGINTIPVTTRPPEIRANGNFEGLEAVRHYIFDCHDHTADTSACGEPSCVVDETSGCSGASCVPDQTSGCSGASCVPDQASACGGATCRPHSPHGHKKTHPFSPEAIAELRQQLDHYIGN